MTQFDVISVHDYIVYCYTALEDNDGSIWTQGTWISAVIFENITVLHMDLPQVLKLKEKNNTNFQ